MKTRANYTNKLKSEVGMASKNKKNKAKNSYLYNGADKLDGRLKKTMYFTKRQRNKNKAECKEEIDC